MDYKKLNKYKQELDKLVADYSNSYEDGESIANDLLDLADGIINKQNAIIQIYEKVGIK